MKKTRKLGIQCLQKRDMMAADIGLNGQSGVLTINGGDYADHASVVVGNSQVAVRLTTTGSDGRTQLITRNVGLQSVNQVVFNGYGGDDRLDISRVASTGSGAGNGSVITIKAVDLPSGIRFNAGDGDDQLTNETDIRVAAYGGNGDDKLRGGSSADTLDGGAGNDQLYGNGGNDYLHGHMGNDIIFGGEGDDRIDGSYGNDYLNGEAGEDTISGGDGNDEIYGGTESDVLRGDAGIDLIYGNGGNDEIRGGSGNDHLWGNDGHDRIFGEFGNDFADGGSGNDKLYGGYGLDDDIPEPDRQRNAFARYYKDSGRDSLHGGIGNDQLYGEGGADSLHGDAGDDSLYGGRGLDELFGGDGNDYLYGYTIPGFRELLVGGAGADSFEHEREKYSTWGVARHRNLNPANDFLPQSYHTGGFFSRTVVYNERSEVDRMVDRDTYMFDTSSPLRPFVRFDDGSRNGRVRDFFS